MEKIIYRAYILPNISIKWKEISHNKRRDILAYILLENFEWAGHWVLQGVLGIVRTSRIWAVTTSARFIGLRIGRMCRFMSTVL
jgi:hypothetical protein